ncbi:MAG: response regulator transcription factor [Spirochaetes bacterium]|nr:response regulator transcription factor [Spirochaetota bacterium]
MDNNDHVIAIVDDEENIRETISYSLKQEGYKALTFSDGSYAWESFQKKMPDLIILDIIMPRMDGLELCRKIRSISETVPIIFLSSKDEELDKILGLEMGGDDYLCKPFSMKELITRIKVIFRRVKNIKEIDKNANELINIGDLSIDQLSYTAKWKDKKLTLTLTEYMLLLALSKYPGHVKNREQLIKEAYSENIYLSDRTIDSHIKRLRKKFIEIDPEFCCIETVYGLGYRFTV